MNKSLPLLFSFFLLFSCSKETFIEPTKIKVMLEKGSDYDSNEPIKYVNKGESVTFLVTKTIKTTLAYVSYQDYQVENLDDIHFNITLNDIEYPLVVSLYLAHETINYHANGGELISHNGLNYVSVPKSFAHLRENSINAYSYFKRDGYQPVGFNSDENYLDETISFGSRLSFYSNDYYVEWKKECGKEEFKYQEIKGNVVIDEYLGDEEEVVVPRFIDDKQVVTISEDAFQNSNLKRVYLPMGLRNIKSEAFYNTNIEELTFCDDIFDIHDKAFPETLKTVHINAVTRPRFSGTYYDTFPDKIDYLNLVKNEKKIILFSGSSTRYGFYSPYFDEEFTGYKTINMGVFAYVNVKQQLDIITSFMKEGDVVISSPEFDVNSLEYQCGTTDFFQWNFFSFVESDYDLLKYIDLRNYKGFFHTFNVYQRKRIDMDEKSYRIVSKHFDDEENFYSSDTYNIQGDFILNRKGNDTDSWIMQPLVNYTLKTITEERVNGLNGIYQKLLNKNFHVYFTFSPKNRNAIDSESTYDEIKKSERYLRENLIVPVISNWDDAILPGTCFYLIDNHLSSDAMLFRSKNVISDLKKYFPFGEKE